MKGILSLGTLFLILGFCAVAQEPRTGDFRFDSPVLSDRTYFDGAETLGRVGNEPILKRDILHQMKKFAYMEFVRQRNEAPAEQKQHFSDEHFDEFCAQFLASDQFYSQVLDDSIKKLLFYNDYVTTRTKEEVEEQKKNLAKVYDREYLPTLLKPFGCEKLDEVKKVFTEKIHSSVEQDKRLFVQQTLGDSWLDFSLGNHAYSPTVVDLRRWYSAHLILYTEPDRVQWHRMSVLFSNHADRNEAMQKIAYMGNAVMVAQTLEERLQLFEQVAKGDSEDFLAAKGGDCGWTGRDELNSREITEALFSEALPIGTLSQVIDDGYGYTIVLVTERKIHYVKPFYEVQEDVLERMKKERKDSQKKKYENDLAQRFAVEIYAISAEERHKMIETARRETESASGRPSAY